MFSRDAVPLSVVVDLAKEVGRLTEQVAALSRAQASTDERLTALDQKTTVTQTIEVLPPAIQRTIDAFANGDRNLYRHLEKEARSGLARGLEESAVQLLIQQGTP